MSVFQVLSCCRPAYELFYLKFLICIKETIEPFHPAMKTLLGALNFNSKHGGMLIYNLNCHLGVLDGKSEEQI